MKDASEGQEMVDIRLNRIVIKDGADHQWIYLTERSGHRGFPIIIGTNEAHEIQRVVTKDAPKRPLTHQLTHAVIDALGGRLARVDIVDLRENTFYAQIVLRRNGDDIVIDARPSDALALGLRAGCPLRVAESVLEQARSDAGGPDPLPDPEEPPEEPE